MQNLLETLTGYVSRVGAIPGETAEERLPKSILVLNSFLFIFAGLAWGCMYIGFGEIKAGLIPLCYGLFSIASLVYYAYSKSYNLFRFSQLTLILVLPFALMTALGGFVNGSAVILWSLICPLGALLLYGHNEAIRWFLGYALLVAISPFLVPLLGFKSSLSPETIQLFFVLNLCAVGLFVFVMFYYFVQRKLIFEKRNEELLLNILPKHVAAELKETGETKARSFESVTVLFTDFENFTAISSRMSAQKLVNEIHYCYSAFDKIIAKYGLEKIKTIGDSYMCVAGLPIEYTSHAVNAVKAALDIRAFIEEETLRRKAKGESYFGIRIGLHSGPVVAGIVGIHKFAFDIWGNTVNIASRLESNSEVGKVNISGPTYEAVKDRFDCRHRGKIEARNKGMIDMYFVEGESKA